MHFLGDEWNRELQEKKTKAKRSKKESPLTIKKILFTILRTFNYFEPLNRHVNNEYARIS